MLYIGKYVQERMNLLSMTVEELANKTFMEQYEIEDIIYDKLALEEIDEFDLLLISNVLHCKPEYFYDKDIRDKDFLINTMNRGNETEKSTNVKVKIQDYLNDFIFVNEILEEDN